MSTRSLRVRRRSLRPARRGQALALVAVMMVGLLGMSALALDLAHLYQIHAQLQGIADASALAAAPALPNESMAKVVAQQYATQNDGVHGTIVDASEVVAGNWDGFGTFTPGGGPINAVRVIARRHASRNNEVGLFFARVLGFETANLSASATATTGGGGGSIEGPTQFIMDSDDLFKQEAELQLQAMGDAASPKVAKDWFLSDHDGDWFIDLPVGTKMSVPTGTESDPALWDIGHAAFPYNGTSNPSFLDFLNYDKGGEAWREALIDEDDLKPVPGVEGVTHPEVYQNFIDPGKCQVSPLNKSDVNNANDINGVPQANADGERLGLLAFSIDSLAPDPDGSSSQELPHLWITICDPSPYLGTADELILPLAANLPLRLVQ